MASKVNLKSSLGSPVFTIKNKIHRTIWGLVYIVFFKFSPKPLFGYRNFILRLFSANIGRGVAIYPSVKIWLPSNLKIEDDVAVGANVIIYNQGDVVIKKRAIVSQGVHICASTHNYNDPLHPLVLSPILINEDVWVCADAFIGPSVTIGAGAVIGARAVIIKNGEAWSVYAGNPAIKIKNRVRFH